MTLVRHNDFWRERVSLPTYRVGEASRYAEVKPQTAARWSKATGSKPSLLSPKPARSALSYLQLIELGVVSALRKAGLKTARIISARKYVSSVFDSRYPFAEYKFRTDGAEIFLESGPHLNDLEKSKVLSASLSGQYGWAEILEQAFVNFEYGQQGIVEAWHLRGWSSPVVIDPRIAFGKPTVEGVPTWVLTARWQAGASIREISEDFDLPEESIGHAIHFEGFTPDFKRADAWEN